MRAAVAESVPTSVPRGTRSRVGDQSPLRTEVVAKTIMILRNIRPTPLLIDFYSLQLWCELSPRLTIFAL